MERVLVAMGLVSALTCCEKEKPGHLAAKLSELSTTPSKHCRFPDLSRANVTVKPSLDTSYSRKQIRDKFPEMWMMVRVKDGKQFRRNLSQAFQDACEFMGDAAASDQPKNVLMLSNWDVRDTDLRSIFLKVRDHASASRRDYTATGTSLGYPRLLVVWQYPDHYKLMVASKNNDNTSLRMHRASGIFSPEGYRVTNLEEANFDDQLLIQNVLSESKTIYPHIEEYLIKD